MKKIKHSLKGHAIALWKDLLFGIPTIVLLILLFIMGKTTVDFLKGIGSLFTSNAWTQTAIGLGMVILVGIGSRNLKKFKFFKKYLPSEVISLPEVAYFGPNGTLQLRILVRTHKIKINEREMEMGEVVCAQASPTSWGHLQGELVPMERLYFTNRTQGNLLMSCASLGAKTKDISLKIKTSL